MDYTQTNVLSMTGGTDFATIADLANYVDLTTNQTITSGIKSFTTLPQSAAVPSTGNQLVNKTYVDGAFVTLGTAQTISGLKTYSGNVRINNTRGLILGTTYPTAGGFINYSIPNVYYDVTGGAHLFFVGGTPTVDFDTGGLLMRTGKKVQFYAGSTIDENSGGNSFDTNIPTGYTYRFKINSVDKLTLHPTFGATFTDNVNIQSNKYLNFSGGSYFVEEPMFDNLIYNVPTSYKHQFRVNTFDTMAISADTNGSILTFPSGTIMREYTSFNWFLYQLPASHALIYQVAGNNILEVSSGGATLYEGLSMRNGKSVIWNEGFTEIALIRKDNVNKYLEYEVATTYSHRFSVNSVAQLLLNTSGATFSTDIKLKFGSSIFPNDATGASMQGTGAGGFRFDADISADYKFYGDAALLLTVAADGVVLNSTVVGAAPMPNYRLFLSANKANYIGSTTTDMRYNCSASGSHNFYQNGTTYLGFINQLGMTLSPNNASLQIGTTSTAQIKHDTATSQLQYRTIGSFNHMFYIDGSLYYEMRTDTFRALRGYQNKLGATGAYVSNNFNFSWSNPSAGALSVWIDTTRLGNMSIVSDYRLKENIVPARPVLDRLCKIKMIEYEFKNVSIFKKNGISHGFIAHEVAELFPELINIIHGEKDALTDDGLIQPQSVGGELTNLYLSGIQELNAKCIAQQAQIDAQQTQMEAMQKQIDGLVLALSKFVSA